MKKSKDILHIYLPSIVVILIVISILIYSSFTQFFIFRQAGTAVQKDVTILCNELDILFSNAKDHITLASRFTSDAMNEKELKNERILNEFYTQDPFFSCIEYIRWDGKNRIQETGEEFDASGRVYYQEGIKGKRGVWTNLNPKSSKAALINFYAPLYYKKEIVGVLTGYLNAEEKIRPQISSDFYGFKTIEILMDQDFKVITATDDSLPYGTDLGEYSNDPFISKLLETIELDSGKSFRFKTGKVRGICCVKKLSFCDYYIAQIIPVKSLKSAMAEVNTRTFVLIIFLIIILVTFIIINTLKSNSDRKTMENSHLSVIEALSYGYQNVYVVNIKTSEFSIYHVTHDISKKYKAVFATIPYNEAINLYCQKEVLDEDKLLFELVNDVSKMEKIFAENKEFSFNYRVYRNNEIHFYQALFIKRSKNENFVAAFKNIDDIIDTENRLSQQTQIVSSIAKVYLTLHMINLVEDTYEEYNTNTEVRSIVNSTTEARKKMKEIMKYVCSPETLDGMLEFTDLETVADRMGDKIYMSQEFVSTFRGWCRGSFIRVDSDRNGKARKVIFATQIIEDEKKKEQSLISIANTDELTQLLNRRAYENKLSELSENPLPDDLVYMAIDLNELKKVNDRLGHAAGDELITGAATCITKAFSKFGSAYRTGGDEFQVILNGSREEIENACEEFDRLLDFFNGEFVSTIKAAYGIVYREDNKDLSLTEMTKLADHKMYASKAQYYANHGIDRRK